MEEPAPKKVYIPEVLPPLSGGYVYYRPPPPRRVWINIVLLAVTFFTTLLAGLSQEGVKLSDLSADPVLVLRGLPFSLTLLVILGAHEMGHFMTAKRYGVDATLPYFIPAPFGVGTFGAVIKMTSPIRSRSALLDIGAAGPVAGMVFAIPAAYIGIVLSTVVPIGGSEGELVFGDPLVFKLMVRVVHGPIPEGYDLSLHPVAFAGWIGMLVTMLNLLPAGQLDGGHIAYAVFGRRADLISKGVFLALLLMAPLTWPGWYIWAFMLLFVIRLRHPPIWDPDPGPLDRKRLLVAILSLVIFILTFMPNPISVR